MISKVIITDVEKSQNWAGEFWMQEGKKKKGRYIQKTWRTCKMEDRLQFCGRTSPENLFT